MTTETAYDSNCQCTPAGAEVLISTAEQDGALIG